MDLELILYSQNDCDTCSELKEKLVDNKIYFEEKPFPGIAPGIVRNGGFLIKGWKDFFKKERLGDEFYHLHVVEDNERERLLLDEE